MPRLTLKKRVGRLLTPGLRLAFRALQPLGFHLVRNHFYEPIPDTRRLPDDVWDRRSGLPGIDMRLEAQCELLRTAILPFVVECDFPRTQPDGPSKPGLFHLSNGYFESVDAEVLHGLLRHFRPRRVIEIGSGHSTMVTARALGMNRVQDGSSPELVSIEPYPSPWLEPLLRYELEGLTRLVREPVENVDLALFSELGENDVLFIDSSHVVKTANDVCRIYLEILPRLAPGVLVHVHDVFLPLEYPRAWVVEEHKFWSEQYLLQSFLAFNSGFEVLWGSSFLSLERPELLASAFPSWPGSYERLPASMWATPTRDRRNVWPVSFWLRRT